MKVCYITQSGFDYSTAERTHAMEVIRALAKLRHNVTVLHPGKCSISLDIDVAEYRPRVFIRRVEKVLFQCWMFAFFIKRKSIQKQFDIVYVRQASLMFVPAFLRQWYDVPLISEFNTFYSRPEAARFGGVLTRILSRIERLALNRSDRIIVVSDRLKSELLMRYDVDAEKIIVLENGVNTELMRPDDNAISKEKIGLKASDFVVGFVGALHPWQGIDPLLQAARELLSNIPELKVVIAGTSNSISGYKKTATDLGLGDCVTFLGMVEYESVPAIVAAFDIAVAPGDAGCSTHYVIRSPLKVYEYLSCGRPVVVGRLGNLECLFAENEVGYVIDPGSISDLTKALKLLHSDPERRKKLGSNARRLAIDRLSWTGVAEKIAKLASGLN